MNLSVAHTLKFFMHLFSIQALLLEVIYGCGMDLEEKHECSDEYVCVCMCV